MPRKLPEGEGKRHGFSFRTTQDLQERLKQAAMKSGRSLAAEVEMRLENSFTEQDRRKEEATNNLVARALLGDDETEDMVRATTAAVGAVLAYYGKHWKDNIFARIAVRSAIRAVYRQQFKAYPLPVFEDEILENNSSCVRRADQIGDLYGRLLSAPQLSADMTGHLSDLLGSERPISEDDDDTAAFASMTRKQRNDHLRELYGIDAKTLDGFEIER